jgi:hypothetical protein
VADVRNRSNSVRENLVRWQTLDNNARLHMEAVAGLSEPLTAFHEVLSRIAASLHDQEVYAMRVRELLETRKVDLERARDLRKRVNGSLIAHFGATNEQIRQFGLRPQVTRRRRKPAGEEPEEPAPTPAPEPSESA